MARQSALKFASKAKAKRQYPETELQKKIVQFLILTGTSALEYFAVPNGVKMSIRTANHQKSIGMKAGVADLMIDVGGKAHYLEVKAKGGVQSPAQQDFQARCIVRGAPYALVDNLDDARDILEAWGAIRKTARRTYTLARAA